MRKAAIIVIHILLIFLFTGCGRNADRIEAERPETGAESIVQEETAEDKAAEDETGENETKEDETGEDNTEPARDITGGEHDEKLPEPEKEPESRYHITSCEPVIYEETECGDIKQEHEEFKNQSGGIFFYYDMECFYFNEAYPAILNETLRAYYDEKKESYRLDSEPYAGGSHEDAPGTPYESLIFFYITYVGDDYVSLVFNDVDYYGAAHPYSAVEGVTIDCSTGEIVTVDRFIDDSDEEIEEQTGAVTGGGGYDPQNWSWFITENSVVFFYKSPVNPSFWDWVATERLR